MIRNYLNYIGSKDRYLEKIMPYLERASKDKGCSTLVDLFCGSAVVGVNALELFDSVVCNDKCKELISIHRWVRNRSKVDLFKEIDSIISQYGLNKQNKEGFLKLRKDYNGKRSNARKRILTKSNPISYIPNTMKKIISIFAMSAALFSLTIVNTGCEAVKSWFHSDNFTTVAAVIAPSIKTASQFTVNAVCKKNPDLTNIFIASANGIKIATNAGSYSTEEIEAYIKQAMGKDADVWYPLVKSSMDTMLSWYDAIYKKYFDKGDDKCLQGFNDILNSLADGVILGANMSKGTVSGLAGASADKNAEAVAVADLKAKCAQYGIEIK